MSQTKQIPTPKIRPIDEGHVVKSFKIGNTQVEICDDCCVKTQAEIDEILRRVVNHALDAYAAAGMYMEPQDSPCSCDDAEAPLQSKNIVGD